MKLDTFSKTISILRVLSLSLLMVVSLLFTSCESDSEQKVIGVILSSTGKAGFIGKPEKATLKMLEKSFTESGLNKLNIRLEIKDSKGSVEDAKTLFNNFSKRPEVLAIIGPSTSGESNGVKDLARERKIPMLSLAASAKIVRNDEDGTINPWVFKYAQNDDIAAKKILRSIIRNDISNIAILSSEDGFGKSGDAALMAAIDNKRLNVVEKMSYPSALVNANTYTSTIVSNDSINAVVIWGTSPGPALLLQSLREKNYKGKVYFSHANASESFLMDTGLSSEGAIVLGSRIMLEENELDRDETSDEVLRRFKSLWANNFDDSPSQFGGYARDAYVSLMQVIDENVLDPDFHKTRKNIRDKLEELENFYGVTGKYNFSSENHTGLRSDAFVIYEIVDNKFVPYTK